jgi:hypothetical protein
MEKRRNPRLNINLPIHLVVEQPETREAQDGKAVLRDISYGGVFFRVEPPLPVAQGHVREFSFYLTPENQKKPDKAHLRAKGLVLRVEPPDEDSPSYGVAVQFLEALRLKDLEVTVTISSRHRSSLPAKLKEKTA